MKNITKWISATWRKFRHYLIRVLQDKAVEQESILESEDLGSKNQPIQIDHRPGLICPECNTKIPVTIEMLLSGKAIICPTCSLRLNVEQEPSKAALDSLQKLDHVLKKSTQ